MPWLFIDTATAGTYRIGLLASGGKGIRTKIGRTRGVLPALTNMLTRANRHLIEGICVVSGPGSFSAIRGGVLVANLLARLLRKPLKGVSVGEAQDLRLLEQELRQTDLSQLPDFVSPQYDAEPNITVTPRA